VIQYVQINGRTKIAVRGQISEYIPIPTRPDGRTAPGPPGFQFAVVMPWAMKSQTSSAVTGRAVAPSTSPG
jgi:hypothetical protein